ncbi:hypothetical protein ADK86_04915 [Streptomyces sp. NRRL F-5755]|uniref:DUF397 domain-containing protein n=1 Tax=Streptomyces sp. NRRL F-5755 TaxID=1519475 RepID=UPI0006AFD232|nr:DUF397 domain-containing protein [Streptomyces sp. NRRL F-5755]KOU07363.1 hypothetical protein ADK86_04915 [Streptomyces sp. NRRL F-5755]
MNDRHEYRKSSYSNAQEECVEVAVNVPRTVAIRDSKHTDGPTLRVSATAWASFLTTLHTES